MYSPMIDQTNSDFWILHSARRNLAFGKLAHRIQQKKVRQHYFRLTIMRSQLETFI